MVPLSVRVLAATSVAAAVIPGCAAQEPATMRPGDAAAAGRADCPVEPVDIVVTVGQWTDLVTTVAGACGHVTTIVGGSAADPHEFEPATSDAARFTDADLVVANGLGYDDWAEHVLDTMSPAPPVVDAGEVVGLHEGDNPHIWYGPRFLDQVADAVTAELRALSPGAADYLDARRAEWTARVEPIHAAVAAMRAGAAGRPFAATEPVFDHMADALGLVDRTPAGYAAATANEADPSPGDVYALGEELSTHAVDVLVFNSQTESTLADSARSRAVSSSVPVVEVTETVPAGVDGFVAWQVGQLDSLAGALGLR